MAFTAILEKVHDDMLKLHVKHASLGLKITSEDIYEYIADLNSEISDNGFLAFFNDTDLTEYKISMGRIKNRGISNLYEVLRECADDVIENYIYDNADKWGIKIFPS